MSKKLQLTLLVIVAIIWTLFSWRWYTCGIKGFCEHRPVVAQQKHPQPKRCGEYLHEFIREGRNNNPEEVRKLEIFLNKAEKEHLTVDGVYGVDDIKAVKRFQEKYRKEILTPWGMQRPSGHVFKTTRAQINKLYCLYTRNK